MPGSDIKEHIEDQFQCLFLEALVPINRRERLTRKMCEVYSYMNNNDRQIEH